MNNKFFTPSSARVAVKLNKYMKENFGYAVEGDIESLQKAKRELTRMKSAMNENMNSKNYVETMLMLETVNALLKIHVEEKSTNPYAVGMAQAMKVTGDKPPLKKSTIKKAHKIAKSVKAEEGKSMNKKKMNESLLNQLNALLEGDAASAETTMAARGIADELQTIIERLGKIQNDQLGPLTDEMMYSHGESEASTFKDAVDSAISALLDNARETKDSVNDAILVLTGEKSAVDTMGADEEFDDMEDFEDEGSMGDEEEPDLLGGDESLAGPENEPLGRARR